MGPRSYFHQKFTRLSGDNTGYGTAWNIVSRPVSEDNPVMVPLGSV